MGNADTDEKVKTLAQWYYDRLHQDTRADGKKFYKFCKSVSPDGKGDESLPEDEEERCRDLAHAAHGDMMPDDWRFEFINEALGAITDASDLDDIELEADVYNSDLCRWLGSHGERPGYCDQAQSEGLVADDADLITRIQLGQYTEKLEVLGLVLQHLRDEADAMDDANEDDGCSPSA